VISIASVASTRAGVDDGVSLGSSTRRLFVKAVEAAGLVRLSLLLLGPVILREGWLPCKRGSSEPAGLVSLKPSLEYVRRVWGWPVEKLHHRL
jgi:hypothetical protein